MAQVVNPPREPNVALLEDQDHPHPLLIRVVLDTVFYYCPRNAWRNLRLVCQTWRMALLDRWREHMRVRVNDLSGLALVPYSELADSEWKWATELNANLFLSLYDPSTHFDPLHFAEHPFKALYVNNSCVVVEHNIVQNNFWDVCGSWLTSLTFHYVRIKNAEVLKRVLFEKTPNVEELRFDRCEVWNCEDIDKNEVNGGTYSQPTIVQSKLKSLTVIIGTSSKDFPISWNSVFSHFPNLQKFALSYHRNEARRYDIRSNMQEVFNALEIVRNATEKKTLNLTLLDLINLKDSNLRPLTAELFAKLGDLSFPLTSLVLYLDGVPNADLAKLLQSFKCLQTLTLNRVVRYYVGDILDEDEIFPIVPYSIFNSFNLETLTKLELNGIIFTDWEFLSGVPNLQEIQVATRYGLHLDVPEAGRRLLLKDLKVFKYFHRTCLPWPVNTLHFLSSVMPNLRTLEATVDIDSFLAICQNWKCLEELTIKFFGVDNQTALFEHLILFTSLKSLRIEIDSEREGGAEHLFGNESIYNGFVKMTQLTKLEANFCPEVEVAALRALQNVIPDTKRCYVIGTSVALRGGYRYQTQTPINQYITQ